VYHATASDEVVELPLKGLAHDAGIDHRRVDATPGEGCAALSRSGRRHGSRRSVSRTSPGHPAFSHRCDARAGSRSAYGAWRPG
jgi:hypothetical protein